MKIGIYSEPQGTIGGSEFCVAVLAEALRQSHEVEILNHRAGLMIDDLSRRFGNELSGVKLRYVPAQKRADCSLSNPWRCFQEAKKWHAELSEPYDLFVNFTHGLPPFCHAPTGVLVVLFPWFNRRDVWPWQFDGNTLRKRLRRFYYDWEWGKRFATYQAKIAISIFTQKYAKRWWDLNCQIIYPPTNNDFCLSDKTNTILSVGRFASIGHTKKQLEMVTTFRQMQSSKLAGWEYFCVGGLGGSSQDIDYFERVRKLSVGGRVHVLANIEQGKLRRLYEQSKIFWHAAGYGEDEDLHPELSEHFGIVTVEAMAAGCVPVVINKGGQAEIVQHGVNGFLWNTLEESKEYTALLAGDEKLRKEMSESSRSRAKIYSKEAYASSFSKLLQPFIH